MRSRYDIITDEYSQVFDYPGPFGPCTDEELDAMVDKIQIKKFENMRAKRNQLLAETDYKLLGDVWSNLTPKQQNDLIQYRQALRDLPSTITDIDNVIYPEKP